MKHILKPTILTALAVSVLALSATAPAMARKGHQKPSFEEIDANADGFLDEAEFAAYHKNHMMQADTDGNGTLSEEEMLAGMKARMAERGNTAKNERRGKKMEKRIGKHFKRMDANGDGQLSPDEITGKRAKHIMVELDENEDGKISKEEYEAHSGKWRHGRG